MDPEEDNPDGLDGLASPAPTATEAQAQSSGEFSPATAPPSPAPAPAPAPTPNRPNQKSAQPGGEPQWNDAFGQRNQFVDPRSTAPGAAAAQQAMRDEYDLAQREYSIRGYSSPHEMMAERGGNRSDFQGGWGGQTMGLASGGRYSNVPEAGRAAAVAPGHAGGAPSSQSQREANTGFLQADGTYGPRGGAVQTDASGNVIGNGREPNTGFYQGNGQYGGRAGAIPTDASGNPLARSDRAGGYQPGNTPAGYGEWVAAGGSGTLQDWNAHALATGQQTVGMAPPAPAPVAARPTYAAPRPAAPAAAAPTFSPATARPGGFGSATNYGEMPNEPDIPSSRPPGAPATPQSQQTRDDHRFTPATAPLDQSAEPQGPPAPSEPISTGPHNPVAGQEQPAGPATGYFDAQGNFIPYR